MLAPVAQHPSTSTLTELERFYALREELDPSWATRPRDIVRLDGRPALLLDDPGGEVLASKLGLPWPLERFLPVAVQLTSALGRLHSRGWVHKHVKPSNLLVDVESGRVWLTGFGIATRAELERQRPSQEVRIAEGTLAYMSPEQTGRTSRSVDARSDLYSVGVTLYQLLSGRLPFEASSTSEWVHSHVARPAAPLEARVPPQLRAIVEKLLAKTPEDRYQSAVGLEADLRQGWQEFRESGSIALHPLGRYDHAQELRVPSRQYGRDRASEQLHAAFERVTRGAGEFVLVSGYSGIGKSSLVDGLQRALLARPVRVARGKFDQYKRDIPYATLAEALQSLLHRVLGESDNELASCRSALIEAVGNNGQLLASLVPELEVLIGPQPPVPEVSVEEAKHRFQLLLQRVLSVFAQREHPLVLFLDDLQWADRATIDLLRYLLSAGVRHLLLIVAYRDNEVDPAHPLSAMIAELNGSGAVVHRISLEPLSEWNVGQMLADTLNDEPARLEPLSRLVHEKTGGNPFFVIQFIRGLRDDGLLVFDAVNSSWSWDLQRILARGFTDNLADFMVGKLRRLSPETRALMTQLACVGRVAPIALLARLAEQSERDIAAVLAEASRAGLLTRAEANYSFPHDRVREASYALGSLEERRVIHLRIGRALYALEPARRDELLFETVNHFNQAPELLVGAEERRAVAELNLTAAKRAKAAIAFDSASKYLIAGMSVLGDRAWHDERELSFALALQRADCEYLTGALDAAEQRLRELAERTNNRFEGCNVACLRAAVYLTQNRPADSIAVCLEQLRRFDIDWQPSPSSETVLAEYELLLSRLPNGSPEALVDLPLMHDPDFRACMDVLLAMEPAAIFSDKSLHDLGVMRMANLSIEHGNCEASPLGFCELSMVIGPRFGDQRLGQRFGELGRALVERQGLLRFSGRVFNVVGYHVTPFTESLAAAQALMRRALAISIETGDLTFRSYCVVHLVALALAAGDPLDRVQQDAEQALEFARSTNFTLISQCLVSLLTIIETLRGAPTNHATDPEQLTDPGLAIAACWHWIRQCQAFVFAGDGAAARRALSKAESLLWTSPTFFEEAEFHFYGGLAHALTESLDGLREHARVIHTWAETNPATFAARDALLSAQVAVLEQRVLDAELLYERAVDAARGGGQVNEEALAHELMARFYERRGLRTAAAAFFGNAKSCYERWGAFGKVRQLERAHAEPNSAAVGVTRQLDLAAVLEMSKAVSSEIVLERLVERLMALAVEHAGAVRGLLILPYREDGFRIEAEAMAGTSGVAVRLVRAAPSANELPESILHYVVRTQQIVKLDDASKANPFADDEYSMRQRMRSVLCFPLVRQGELAGVLYLENQLTSHAFTPDRIAMLRVLASHAAISLENARLYGELRRADLQLAEAQRLSLTGSFGWPIERGHIAWSEEARRIYGFPPGTKQTAEDVLRLIDPEDQPAVLEELALVRQGKDFVSEFRITSGDGIGKFLRVVGRPVRGDDGQLEYVGAVLDITAAKRAEEELRWAQRRYALTLSSIGDGVIATDAQKCVAFMNPVAESLTGWELGAAVGQPLDEVFLVSRELGHPMLQCRLGGQVPIDERRSPILDRGDATGEVLVFRDVTQQRRAEEAEALQLANDRLEQALRGSNVGIWDFSLLGRSAATGIEQTPVHWVNQWESLGYSAEPEQRARQFYPERWHAEDRVRFAEAVAAHLRGEARAVEVESRFLHRDGSLRWRLNRGLVLRSAGGEPLRLIGTSVDISDRKRLEEELIRARDEAEAGNRAKDAFLANVSHEIRTPMNAIIGMTDLVLDMTLPDEQRHWLTTVKSAADNLLLIIEDLLDFSKIEAGKVELHSGRFSLREQLGDVVSALGVRARSKGLQLTQRVADDVPDQLLGDAGRLRQVLINLVENAIKFTPAGSVSVDVKLESVEPAHEVELHFAVRDTGIGIPLDKQAVIFQAFAQQDTTTTRQYGGTGLGLTIAARLAALMAGSIGVRSEPGKGSTFLLSARFCLAQLPREGMRLVSEGRTEQVSATPALRVLVAEDNRFNSELIRQLLARRGYEPTVASDGNTALSLAQQGGFDLMLLDLHMPGLDGFAVIERVRASERARGSHLYVIALTARSRKEDRDRCLAAGMDDFLAKPIHASALWAAVERAFSATRLDSELIDARALLAACGEDGQALQQIADALREHLPPELDAAASCLAAGDLPSLREAAHRILGMVSAASSRAGAIAAQLEDVAVADQALAAERLLAELDQLSRATLSALDRQSIERLRALRERVALPVEPAPQRA